ncbi:MAG: SulP family inorganic anion transporter [Anaerolineales bacterium]
MIQTTRQSLRSILKDAPNRFRLPQSLSVGVLQGAIEVFLAASLASLIFSGSLEALLPLGITLALLTGAIHLIGSALTSSSDAIHGSIQDVPAVLVAVMLASVAASIGSQLASPTVFALLAVSTLATGLTLLALGTLKLGGLARYVPYPVIGGFLAATGWLLVAGGFSVVAGISLTQGNISMLREGGLVIQWLPAVVVALVLMFVSRRAKSPLALPRVIGGALVASYLALIVSGTTIDEATAMGLLFEGGESAAWSPLNLELFGRADWTAILGQAGNIVVLAGMTLIALLLSVSAIELSVGRELDLNRELKGAGIANVLSGLGGGLIGYHALSTTALSGRLGARGRMVGIVAGVVCLAALLVGTSLLTLIPKALFGGLLMFLGLDFIYDWVVLGWSRFSRLEYAIVLLIMGVVAATNFLAGVAVGLMMMVIIFVVNYSRTRVIRHAYSGSDIQSMVVRSAEERRLMAEAGSQVEILELQGFLFFGTANTLLKTFRESLAASDSPVRFIVMDFRLVTGIDSSAALALYKCEQSARAEGIILILTGASDEDLKRLHIGGLDIKSPAIKLLDDLDQGLEWCENQIVKSQAAPEGSLETNAQELLVRSGMSKKEAKRLASILEPIQIGAGEPLMQEGDPAEDMYFILSGRVSVWAELHEGQTARLRTLGPGTTVGEIGLYLHSTRSANVLAEEPTEALKLSGPALEAMQEGNPKLLAAFHEMIARQLSEWVVQSDRGMRALRG